MLDLSAYLNSNLFNLSKANIDIPPLWIRGIHADESQAKRQAVEIDNNANIYFYPKFVLKPPELYGSSLEAINGRKKRSTSNYKLFKLPLPGTREFAVAAEAAVSGNTIKSPKEYPEHELRITRKHIIFPPAALRATKEFEEAIYYALQLTTDGEKFSELQHIFKEFGYYYPYWITTGGDLSLLYNDIDIDGWLESTATHQVLIKPLDINPMYDLLGDEISSEVQRIYGVQYYQPSPQVNTLMEADNSTANALIRLSKIHGKVGVTKGVHFGGSLAEEDTVELVSETDITKLMRLVSVAGKARIERMMRHTILGTNISTHAFLPSNFLDRPAEDSEFVRAAMAHHAESNSGELQPSTREVRYFVMYVTYSELVFDPEYIKGTDKFKQAVIKALDTKSDKEKYQELQKVFGRFGYFYPSSISIGGRMVYKIRPNDPPSLWLSEDGIENIDILIKKNSIEEYNKNNNNMETIGGKTRVSQCQDWIDSIQTNQTRTQFGSLRPIYELLDDEQRTQVLQLYNGNQSHIDNFPEIPKGLHFGGTEAKDQAVEFVKDKFHFRMIMLKDFSDQPNVEHVKRYADGFEDIDNYLSLDIDTSREFPGVVGFVSGSEGAYKERSIAYAHHCSKTETPYELYLYDEFIQLTSQFKEAIDKALLVGDEDQDTYSALQDVFQRFGYYYPSSVQIGGRIALHVPLLKQKDQSQIQHKDSKHFYEESSKSSNDHKSAIVEITQLEEEVQEYTELGNGGVIIKTEQRLSKDIVTNAIEKSLAKSERWKSIGGDAIVLMSNDVKGWINTVELSQTVTQRRGLKPIYELLDQEQSHKVRQTYENIILEDAYVRYDHILKLALYDKECEDEHESTLETSLIPTEALFEKLLAPVFPDSNVAIQFCRSACADYGFSVIEENATDKIICIYCSRSVSSESTLKDLQNKQEKENFCQWGVMLSENNDAQWQFQRLSNNDESMHNHQVTSRETESHPTSQISGNPYIIPVNTTRVIVKRVFEPPVSDQDILKTQYVRYGDIVLLQVKNGTFSGTSVSASKALEKTSGCSLEVGERFELQKRRKFPPGLDVLWKIVPCSVTGDEDKDETDEIDDKGKVTYNNDYVRSSDIVAFESQATPSGTIQVRGCFTHLINNECVIPRDGTKPYYKSCRYHIRNSRQYALHNEPSIERVKKYTDEKKKMITRKLFTKNNLTGQYELGRAYMYGALGLDIDNARAFKYLQVAADGLYADAFYYLGKLLWKTKEYQKALDMYEEAALFSDKGVYRELGDIYSTGFSIPHLGNSYTIPQNQKLAFMYYSIGGMMRDANALVKVGEFYEQGRLDDFGIDLNKALRWYKCAGFRFGIPEAKSAFGRVKHCMANAAKDPLEADKLRREAYDAFEIAAMYDPYAKFMVAVYNLNGWGCQQPDPVLGFGILLSLVETGLNMVLRGIAKCYEQGVGVERDLSKASAYQQLAAQMDAQ
ncbi:hypothetical protein DFQ28_002683 [Apophysomyces sp. BC1034]|nr:hypothetical protein DFQ28_002683 [Apophysomyces sp. BC1034]